MGEGIAFSIFLGMVIGAAINIIWMSVDALLGTATLTDTRAFGVLGLSTVLTPCGILALLAWDEVRSARR